MKEFPHSKLLIMAVLDTIQFAGLAISAAGVSPAMTVILLHTSTPFLVIGSKYAFPDRKYSVLQMSGVQLISLAVLVCLIGSFTHKHHGSDKTASNFLYIGMAALHGLSTLYKVRNHLSLASILKREIDIEKLFQPISSIFSLMSGKIYHRMVSAD
jgi:hypothetical protein